MCELLVLARDNTHADPIVSATECYKKGDVVTIQNDGHPWGAGELDTTVFNIVKLSGVPIADKAYLLNGNLQPVKLSAMQKIAKIAQHVNQQIRDPISRKRYKVDPTTKAETDKART